MTATPQPPQPPQPSQAPGTAPSPTGAIAVLNVNDMVVTDGRVNLMGYNRHMLEVFFVGLGEKKFRATQVLKWVHQLGVLDFNDMSNLPKSLQTKLAEMAYIAPPHVVSKQFSADGTRKWVFAVGDGNRSLIETVLIPADNGRKTLCISSQVGCALDCSFCSTGKQGFERDLTGAEIIGQLWVANQSYMQGVAVSDRTRSVTNVVMMGMGEPLLNFDPVVTAMDLMLEDHAYGMSKRRVTLSTSGVVPMMDKLYARIDVALAISLHATNNKLRDELVPINKKYPLEQLMAAARRYVDFGANQRRHVTIEYVMLDGVNDQLQHAKELVALLGDIRCKVNLIPFNPFPHAPYKRSTDKAIAVFQNHLNNAGLVCTVRSTRGDDIDAACGQLVGQVQDRTRRSAKWQKSIQAEQ